MLPIANTECLQFDLDYFQRYSQRQRLPFISEVIAALHVVVFVREKWKDAREIESRGRECI